MVQGARKPEHRDLTLSICRMQRLSGRARNRATKEILELLRPKLLAYVGLYRDARLIEAETFLAELESEAIRCLLAFDVDRGVYPLHFLFNDQTGCVYRYAQQFHNSPRDKQALREKKRLRLATREVDDDNATFTADPVDQESLRVWTEDRYATEDTACTRRAREVMPFVLSLAERSELLSGKRGGRTTSSRQTLRAAVLAAGVRPLPEIKAAPKPARVKRISDVMIDAIRAAGKAGEPYAQIAERFGISRSTTQAIVRALGPYKDRASPGYVPPKKRPKSKPKAPKGPKKPRPEDRFTPELVREIRARYVAGESMRSLVSRFGSHRETLTEILAGKKHCPPGSEDVRRRNVRGPAPKLSGQQVDEIRLAHSQGESQTSIGKRFGVSPQTIGQIVNGQRWAARPWPEGLTPPTSKRTPKRKPGSGSAEE